MFFVLKNFNWFLNLPLILRHMWLTGLSFSGFRQLIYKFRCLFIFSYPAVSAVFIFDSIFIPGKKIKPIILTGGWCIVVTKSELIEEIWTMVCKHLKRCKIMQQTSFQILFLLQETIRDLKYITWIICMYHIQMKYQTLFSLKWRKISQNLSSAANYRWRFIVK